MKYLKLMLCASALALSTNVHAQDFPGRAVTMVVPFSPGGSNDIIARYLAEGLGELWDGTVIVDNQPGAGATIGASAVARADPDGHTLLFVSLTLAASDATRELPFDVLNDLDPVGMAANGANVIVTGSRISMPTVEDLVQQAQSQQIFYGTTGVGSSTQFAALAFAEAAGIGMDPVHYNGSSDALVDLAGGRLDVYTGSALSILSPVDSGSATPIAIMGANRSPLLPDVPTVAEAGYPEAEYYSWWGVFAPAGTPQDVIAQINEDMNAVLGTPEAAEFLATQGVEPNPMSIEEFSSYFEGQIAMFRNIADRYDLAGN